MAGTVFGYGRLQRRQNWWREKEREKERSVAAKEEEEEEDLEEAAGSGLLERRCRRAEMGSKLRGRVFCVCVDVSAVSVSAVEKHETVVPFEWVAG